MSHPNSDVIRRMMQSAKYGMDITEVEKAQDCLACTNANHTQRKYNGKLITEENTITIYANTCGPIQTRSHGGDRYFLLLTTGEKKNVRVRFLKRRDKLIEYFEIYISWLERHSGRKVGRIHSENAPEFVEMRKEFDKERNNTDHILSIQRTI